MLKIRILVLGLMMVASMQLLAQSGNANIEFIENKGQWDKKVMFKGELTNGAFFLQKSGFTVLLHHPDDLSRMMDRHGTDSSIIRGPGFNGSYAVRNSGSSSNTGGMMRSHAYTVAFINANENVTAIPDKPLPSYTNYFIGNDASKWATNCQVFQGITYKNIYPNIDIRYYAHDGGLKYDIIVHPGGDVNRIMMKYDGVDKMTLNKGRLMVKTSVGDVQELEPVSYQFSSEGKIDINCKYELMPGNLVRFKVKNYSPETTLIIDPTLVFATFTGSKASNWGFTATPGPDGSFFAGGIVFGSGFPVSPGAFQQPFKGGDFDIGIMKFSSNGSNRIYATYIGGNNRETPHSLFADAQGNLVILGRTYSGDFPFKDTVGKKGLADMFVMKLNGAGNAIIGSMRIGGEGNDCVNIEDQYATAHEAANSLIRNYGDDSRSEVVLDKQNNIYVAASTQSKDFPVTAGAFQTGFGGGLQDGVVLKINPNCNAIIFASYLGGKGEDAAFVLKVNPANNNIYVAGATTSTDFPGNKTGSIQSGYQGGICDGFVTIISNDGATQIKTSYFGTSGSDALYGIDFDKKGFPYIMGTTTGSWPVTPGIGFVNVGAKQFISKLQPDLTAYVYSTTFGKAAGFPNISPVAFLVDRCENVYASGWGGWIYARADSYGLSGTIGMPVTPDAIKPNTDGRDFYFIVIKKNASGLLYGTFFGQTDGPESISEHVDGGTSRYDQFGVIYQAICANCGGRAIQPMKVTPGAWSPRNGTARGSEVAGCNLAALKIAFNFAGVTVGLKSFIHSRAQTSGCIPLEVTFDDTVRNAKQYIWSFGDGSPDTNTISPQVVHTYNLVGNYLVRLIAIDSNTCNVSDTVYTVIKAKDNQASLAYKAFKLPPCESLTYQFDNLSVAPASLPFTDSSFVWDFGDGTPTVKAGLNSIVHPYASAGTYISKLMLVDTNYCNYPDELDQTLRIAPLVKAQFNTPDSGCAPYSAFFDNTTLAGQQFYWDFGDGTTSQEVNPIHIYNDIGTYTVRLVAVDSATCNIIDSTKKDITVNPNPKAIFTSSTVRPEPNHPTIFFNSSTGATHFKWIFGDGDTAMRYSVDTILHQYQETGTFQACLVAYNEFECSDTACIEVEAIVNPLLDVPNAFTPGRFGQNSIIKVHGFGIASMTFRIYNRFGQIVFESNNPNDGWDGNFKGNPQPMGVYAYTLEASYFDGKKTTRKGDITLIR